MAERCENRAHDHGYLSIRRSCSDAATAAEAVDGGRVSPACWKPDVLKSGDPVELLEGWLVTKMSRNPPHDANARPLSARSSRVGRARRLAAPRANGNHDRRQRARAGFGSHSAILITLCESPSRSGRHWSARRNRRHIAKARPEAPRAASTHAPALRSIGSSTSWTAKSRSIPILTRSPPSRHTRSAPISSPGDAVPLVLDGQRGRPVAGYRSFAVNRPDRLLRTVPAGSLIPTMTRTIIITLCVVVPSSRQPAAPTPRRSGRSRRTTFGRSPASARRRSRRTASGASSKSRATTSTRTTAHPISGCCPPTGRRNGNSLTPAAKAPARSGRRTASRSRSSPSETATSSRRSTSSPHSAARPGGCRICRLGRRA